MHPVDRWKTKEVKNFTAKPLYKEIISKGKLVYKCPPLKDICKKTQESLDEFWEEYKRIEKPQVYKVDLSDKLYQLKQKMLTEQGKAHK